MKYVVRCHHANGTWDSPEIPQLEAAEALAFFLVNNGVKEGMKIYPPSTVVMCEINPIEESRIVQ